MPSSNFKIKYGLDVDGSILSTALTANQIVETNASKQLITAVKGTAYNKAFGTTAGTVTEGNDARLTDARTPLSHVHGNITNAGAIGSTANLPLITTTGGVITVGSFGTGANTFCMGNDSRLSDARTPLSHIHGNITNAGAIGSISGLPIITTTSGVLTTGSFGSAAGTFCEGNDSRLSDSRTPLTHDIISSHSASGLTTGHFLRATSASTFAFSAVNTSHIPESGNLYYTEARVTANASVTANTAARHTQNTDTGTTATSFAIDSAGTGFRLKNSAGEVQLRNLADAAYADLRVKNLIVTGTTTTINSETVTVDDNILVLNNNYTGSAPTEAGGIEIERGTFVNASLIWDETSDLWKAGVSGSELAIVLTDDSRLTDARTPTSHSHGNISNTGYLGSTASIPLITGTGGIIQAGSFGSTAGTFCEGNDSRLSDSRTPLSHTHGQISNLGAIGSTANLPVITTTSGVLTTGTWGTAANTFCQGNDARLSDARTPVAHVLDSATHTISGKTAGQVLLATGATTYAFTTISNDATINGSGQLTISNGRITESKMQSSGGGTLSGGSTGSILGWNTGGTFQWVTAADPTQVGYTYGQSTSFQKTALSTASQVLDSFAKATFRSVKWILSVYDIINSRYETLEIAAVHDGTNVYFNEYGNVHTTTSPGITFDVIVNGANIELKGTGTSTNNTIKGIRTTVNV